MRKAAGRRITFAFVLRRSDPDEAYFVVQKHKDHKMLWIAVTGPDTCPVPAGGYPSLYMYLMAGL